MESRKFNLPAATLDDLSSRFLLHVPAEEQEDAVRLCFQVEAAHWFYLDFWRAQEPTLPQLGLRDFARAMFNHCPFLLGGYAVESVLDSWKEFKLGVPTYGAIILDESLERVLLVQGYLAMAGWSFPKGKVNEEEAPVDCAVREVLEETGFDIRDRIDPSSRIELRVGGQCTRLYIITGVPLQTKFVSRTRNEIRSIDWFLLKELPCSRHDQTPKNCLGLNANKFFMAIPFIRPLKEWISHHGFVSRDMQTANLMAKDENHQATQATEMQLLHAQQLAIFREKTNHQTELMLQCASGQRKRDAPVLAKTTSHSQKTIELPSRSAVNKVKF
uniref:m7GpppN-mRNA hydrolase-like n=1 Tax=Myxine glutinosa TaxID=7769 RepID=UPI00359023E9